MRKKVESTRERAYHHGNLRKALLEAALRLIETDKEEALSLRTVAASAGVSNGAPYRHFADRQALLTALAAIGFDRLYKAFAKARKGAKTGAVLADMASAYLCFAARNPGLYRLMFTHNHLAVRFDGSLAKTAAGAFHELESAVQIQLTNPAADAKLVATALWSTVHGVATLTFERLITVDGPSSRTQARDIGAAAAQLVVDSILQASGARAK